MGVLWAVVNRPPNSNLIFDQILDGGRAVPVELPRAAFWIASEGTGTVAPVPPESGTLVRLRLRLVDVISGDVLDEADLFLPVVRGG